MSATSEEAREGVHVLVIDATQELKHSLESALSGESFVIKSATTGAQGCTMARKGYPDAIICAEELPNRESGVDVIRRLRQSSVLSRVPILLLGGPKSDLFGADSRPDAYLPRPFALDELIEQLKALLARRPNAPTGWLQGDLRGFGLPDVLVMVQQNRLTGLLVVLSDEGLRYRFLFTEGSLISVTGPEVSGAKALNRALRLDAGQFGFHAWERVERKPWHEEFRVNNMLLGAMQEKDELPMLRRDMPDAEQHLTIAPNFDDAVLSQYETLAGLRDGKAIGLTVDQLLDQSKQTDLDALHEIKKLIDEQILIPFP